MTIRLSTIKSRANPKIFQGGGNQSIETIFIMQIRTSKSIEVLVIMHQCVLRTAKNYPLPDPLIEVTQNHFNFITRSVLF